ncbi:MAG: 30S ribosomal protein S16 [bacterium]|nr:30S ribosomal protein S16 [bacterium]
MLTIRLFRIGKKHQPSYKIVVTDKRNSARGGRFVDEVGYWNPLTKQKSIDGEKVKGWIAKGAKASDTVHNIFVAEKVLKGGKIDVHKKSKKPETPAENK